MEGTVYDAEKKKCVSSGVCGKFDCSDQNSLKKISHTDFPRYFAMCKSATQDSDGPLVVGVCPPYYRIDPKSQVCEADCQTYGNGNLPYAADCHKYWTCKQKILEDSSLYMFKKLQTCPTGTAFDSNKFLCVPDADGKICGK